MTKSYQYYLVCTTTGNYLQEFPYVSSALLNRIKNVPNFSSKKSPLVWANQSTVEAKYLEYNIAKAIRGDSSWPEVKIAKKEVVATEVPYSSPNTNEHARMVKLVTAISSGATRAYTKDLIYWLIERNNKLKSINYVIVCTEGGSIPQAIKSKASHKKDGRWQYIGVDTNEDMMLVRLSGLEVIGIYHPEEGVIYKHA